MRDTHAAQIDERQGKQDAQVAYVEDKLRPQGEKEKKEIGGRGGLEPTRFGDWERAGRCIDF